MTDDQRYKAMLATIMATVAITVCPMVFLFAALVVLLASVF